MLIHNFSVADIIFMSVYKNLIFNLYVLYVIHSRFYDKRDAEDAMESLDGRVLDGRELRVQMARYFTFK